MRYFTIPSIDSIHYLVCGNLMSQDGFLHHRRCFHENVLILVLEGTLFLEQSGVAHTIRPNQYILLHTDEEHCGIQPSSGKLSYLWVHFTADLTETDSLPPKNTDTKKAFCVCAEVGTTARTKRFSLLFHQLLDFSRQDTLYTSQMMDYALRLLLMELTQEQFETSYENEHAIPPMLYTIMEWIRANCYQHISVSEIADHFEYNKDYLSALFKKHTGSTLIQYLNQSRIEIAKNLLANYQVSIKEAAFSCGFLDEKYFMRIFKSLEGVTPTEYKHAFHKKNINS